MRTRLFLSVAMLGSVAFGVVGGCGGEDDSGAGPTGGSGGSTMGGSAGSAANAGNTTGGSIAGTTSTGGTMGSPEPTGSVCQVADDCYKGLDVADLSGPAECIDKVDAGYCTHECETDDDCCAIPGECRTGFKQVCSSFENTDKKYCFLSCEEEDLVAAGGAGGLGSGGMSAVDATEYCEREANPRFGCRSTGGGNENRRVCLPAAGAGGAGPGNGGAGGAPDMGGAPGMGGAPDTGGAPGAAGQSEGGALSAVAGAAGNGGAQ